MKKSLAKQISGILLATSMAMQAYNAGAAASAPTISKAPTNAWVGLGSNYTFSVTAGGTNLSYQWFTNTVAVSNATDATLLVTSPTQAQNTNTYFVVVTNGAGAVTSSPVTLTVQQPVAITGITDTASSSNVASGSTWSIGVACTGDSLAYVWTKGNVAVSAGDITSTTNGTTNSISAVAVTDSGTYTCKITNHISSATTNFALDVIAAPVITSKLAATNVVALSSNVTLSVTASGSFLTYYWSNNAVAVPSSNTNKLVLPGTYANAGHYEVLVSNIAGVVSNTSTVIVQAAPSFLLQPIGSTNSQSATAPIVLTALAAGDSNGFVWTVGGKVVTNGSGNITITNHFVTTNADYLLVPSLSGSITNNTNVYLSYLTITGAKASNSGVYQVAVSNAVTTLKSTNVNVLIVAPGTVTPSEAGVAVLEGASATLKFTVTGSGPFTNALWFSNACLTSVTNTTITNTISSMTLSNVGAYWLIATNFGGVASNKITVSYIADTNPPAVSLSGLAKVYTTNTGIIVKGSATDNVAVSNVQYAINGGSWTSASTNSSTNWKNFTFTVSLNSTAGTNNVLLVKAEDINGNVSKTLTNYVTYAPFYTMTVTSNGDGIVKGTWTTNGVQWGQTYTATAVPAGFNLFTHWTVTPSIGSASNVSTTAWKFTPTCNLTLAATFVTNNFVNAGGTYNGVFSTNASGNTLTNLDGAGYISLTLSSNLAYSGKLHIGGVTMPMSGSFAYGGYLNTNLTNGELTATVDLTNDFASNFINGVVTCGTYTVTNLVAGLDTFGKNNPVTNAGSYTMTFYCDASDGYGFAFVTVASNGAVSVTGTDPKGASFSQSTTLTEDNLLPFYAGLYPVKSVEHGAIWGWLQLGGVTNEGGSGSFGPLVMATNIYGNTNMGNTLSWIVTNSTAGYWMALYSSPFTPPAKGDYRVITNQLVTLRYTVPNVSFHDETLAISEEGTIGSDGVSTMVISKTGLITGTVVDTNTSATYKLQGAVLQNGNNASIGMVGAGIVINSTNVGGFSIVPVPVSDQTGLNGN